MSDCPSGKKSYGQKRTALTMANTVGKLNHDDMTAYWCPQCDGWHIGHPPGSGYAEGRSTGKRMRKKT